MGAVQPRDRTRREHQKAQNEAKSGDCRIIWNYREASTIGEELYGGKNLTSFQKSVYIFVALAIVILATTAFLLTKLDSQAHISDYIGALAAVSIVILTAAYVLVTTKQLDSMQGQLNEMKLNREQTMQPLAMAKPSNITLEKPRFFYSPPGSKYGGHSRLMVDCEITNHGNAPAISVNTCACVSLFDDNNQSHCGSFRSVMQYINVISTDGHFAKADFMFQDEMPGKIIDAIRTCKYAQAPVLRICSAYKNILGACFSCRQAYHLFYEDRAQDTFLENWQCQIKAFDSLLKKELTQLERLYDKDDSAWDELFEQSKEKFADTVIGDHQKLKSISIPKSFTASAISTQRYDNFLDQSSYGQYLGGEEDCLGTCGK